MTTKETKAGERTVSPQAHWLGKERLDIRGETCEYVDGKRKQKAEYLKSYTQAIKTEVFRHYSKGVPSCACCGQVGLDFLSIDHVEGGGNEHRRSLNGKRGVNFYRWLRTNNYPNEFQVLCFNCNFAKGHSGSNTCPHITYSLT